MDIMKDNPVNISIHGSRQHRLSTKISCSCATNSSKSLFTLLLTRQITECCRQIIPKKFSILSFVNVRNTFEPIVHPRTASSLRIAMKRVCRFLITSGRFSSGHNRSVEKDNHKMHNRPLTPDELGGRLQFCVRSHTKCSIDGAVKAI
jgi:hypothetical protein